MKKWLEKVTKFFRLGKDDRARDVILVISAILFIWGCANFYSFFSWWINGNK